jgi:hypothetical protein
MIEVGVYTRWHMNVRRQKLYSGCLLCEIGAPFRVLEHVWTIWWWGNMEVICTYYGFSYRWI